MVRQGSGRQSRSLGRRRQELGAGRVAGTVLAIAVTRFRMAWQWNGGSATLQSRATDEEGNVQPTGEKLIAERGNKAFYHCNSITTWGVSQTGEVKHVYG